MGPNSTKTKLIQCAIESGDSDVVKLALITPGHLSNLWSTKLMQYAKEGTKGRPSCQVMIQLQSELGLSDSDIRKSLYYIFVGILKDGSTDEFWTQTIRTRLHDWEPIVEECIDSVEMLRLILRHRHRMNLTDDFLYETFCNGCEHNRSSVIQAFQLEFKFTKNTYLAYRFRSSDHTFALFNHPTLTPIPKHLYVFYCPTGTKELYISSLPGPSDRILLGKLVSESWVKLIPSDTVSWDFDTVHLSSINSNGSINTHMDEGFYANN